MPKDFDVNENSSARYTGVLKDSAGVAIAAASLTTLKLTLYNIDDLSIINTRNKQDVLNLNNVTVDVNGNLVWSMKPADNPIVTTAEFRERHRALFEFTYNAGDDGSNHEVDILVANLNKIP